jgi:catechol 2,3-dioxygenase-like lactoylglutathione lyase family enzyme
MSLALDHVVIHVIDLEAAIADYTAVGFTVQRGGTHADGATHNALVGFADGSYLELIAFLRPSPAHRWAAAAEQGREGFIDFALLPVSVAAVVHAARSRGLAYQGPIDGGRLRPDGERLKWQIGTPPTPDLPFLCGDISPRSMRVREGDVRMHANGVKGVASITVAVANIDASLTRYGALLGPAALQSAHPVAMPGLGLRSVSLPLAAVTLVLAAPGPDSHDGHELRAVLAQRGEGVLGLALHRQGDAPAVALPRDRTHNAAFEIVPAEAASTP